MVEQQTTALVVGFGGDAGLWVLPRKGEDSVESLHPGDAGKS